MLPDMALVANGMALAFKLRREPRVAMTFFGEGSTANGQWHEAMNFAGVQRLPVVFVLENNRFAYSTPNELEFAVDPVERAAGYGFPGVDGRRQRRRGRLRGRRRGGRARPRRRRPDADRVPDDAHARPRRPRRHELRARRSCSTSGRERDPIERYSRAAGRASTASARARSSAIARRGRGRGRRGAERALASPMPDPAIARERRLRRRVASRSATGDAPWSRYEEGLAMTADALEPRRRAALTAEPAR